MENTVIVVSRNGMGDAEPALQRKLATTFFSILAETKTLPNAICFYGDGVKLTVTGSPVLDSLRTLENAGVRLVLCQTCLNYYGLTDQVEVGIVGGMTDIIEAQRLAGKILNL